jgi:medium-chain acyl-[acyl-carrier-protein] hydrolase
MTMTQLYNNKWLRVFKPNPHAKLRLFCLPFAGGGCQFFRDWHENLPISIEVCGIQLPGREKRIQEKPMTRHTEFIDQIIEAVRDRIGKPYAIFGHSMGALLGYEVVRAIRSAGISQPCLLVSSGRRAPHLPQVLPLIHALPDEQFIEEVKGFNGTPKEVIESKELLELIMPILRADFTLCETYTYDSEPPLPCSIKAYGGLQDHTVSREELDAWQQHTARTFTMRMFPGDHFYIQSSRPLFFQFLTHDLLTALGEST